MNTKGLTDFFEQNWKPLAGALLVVLVILGGASIWNERRKAREQQAADLLFELQKNAQTLAQAKKPAEAEKALQPLFDRFPSSRAAYEATLQSGDWWMENQSYKEAIGRYQKAVSLATDPFSRLLARYDLAIAQEAAGNYQEAVTSYGDALAVEGSDFLQPEIMLAQGRCYEALKQAAKAIDIYKQIEAKFGSRGPYYAGVAAAFESRLSGAGESQ
jgi:predicted negative regulator of RcsB-dependent stress response